VSDPIAETLEQLASDDVRVRTLALQTVRQVDLDDMRLLDRVLELCGDTTPLPDDLQPPTPEDPFAEFFGASGSGPAKTTVADKARERLVFTGVIGKAETVEHLAAALDRGPPTDALVQAVVKLLSETRWSDRLAAVKALVPRLHRADAAMYEVVAQMKETEHRVMVRSALSPYNSRAVNELLNHGPSKALMEDALVEAITGGHMDVDERIAADALTLLVSWDSRHAGRVAVALADRFPWAVLVSGLNDPRHADALRSWLDSGAGAPMGLVRKLDEVLKNREDVPHFPIDAWLRYSGSGVDVVRRWRCADRCRAELEAFVAAWQAGEHADRGWAAVEALAEAGLHTGIEDAIHAGLADDANADFWSRRRFELLCRANPRIEGLVEALTDLALRRPETSRFVVPAVLQGYDADVLRPLTERYIALAESKRVIRKPSRKGLIHEEREGVDTAPFQEVVAFLGDDALRARLEEVLPYVRAEDI
jgi:hypothetical protein